MLLLLFQPAKPDASLRVKSAQSRPDLDQLFQQTSGWTGGDGVYSVQLSNKKLLWLFSDTWVGDIQKNKHVNATIVNNTVALQDDPKARPVFFIRRNAQGQPQAIVTPVNGRGWYWLFAGAQVQNKLLLFLPQLEKTDDKSVFGFRGIGMWLGVVENPHDDPLTWRVTQTRLPHALYTSMRERTFGAALLTLGEYLYIYGTEDTPVAVGRKRHLILARARLATATDPGTWEFYGQGNWHRQPERCEALADEMASEASVVWLPARKQYVLVYTRGGMSNEIRGRVASQPWGPWSEPVTLFRCPETGWDRRVFCYAAKAHHALSQGNTLIISYVANATDFWYMAGDARLYWPRFVEVELVSNQK